MGIGTRLKEIIDEKGTNVNQIAKQTNTPPMTIYSIIKRDNTKVDIDILLKICKALDVSVEDIYQPNFKNNDSNNISKIDLQDNKKSTTADRLKQIMRERNLKQVDILEACEPYCEKYGVKLGKNDLSQYISGKVTPGQDKLTILGLALDVNEAWLRGYNLPSGRKDLDHIEQKLQGGNCCKLLDKCHDAEIFNAVKLLIKLDTLDLGRVIGSIEEMLKAEKYTAKSPCPNTIYRAARSADNNPSETVETTKDFSKIPTTKNKNL